LVVGVDVDPFDARGIPGGAIVVSDREIRGHRPEITVVLWEIDIRFRWHLRVAALVGPESGFEC